jgi:hypothetical protein
LDAVRPALLDFACFGLLFEDIACGKKKRKKVKKIKSKKVVRKDGRAVRPALLRHAVRPALLFCAGWASVRRDGRQKKIKKKWKGISVRKVWRQSV